MKQKLQNITLGVGSICCALIFIEVMLPFFKIKGLERFVYLRKMPIVQYIYGEYHPILGNLLQPHLINEHIKYKDYVDYTVSTNSYGFRGPEWDTSKNRKNIIVLGDSYTFGWGVEESQIFTQILQQRLQGIDPAFQVINLGQSGFFLDQIVNSFDIFGKQFDPILVIYLYCSNDANKHPPEINEKFDIENFRMAGTPQEFSNIARMNNSNIWRFERFFQGMYLYAFHENYVRPLSPYKSIKHPNRAKKERFIYTYKNLMKPSPPKEKVKLNKVKNRYIWYCLNTIYNLSKNKPLILMDTSDKLYIHRQDSNNSDRWILRDFANQYENVFFIDFESTIRELNDGIPRFLPVDDHWNQLGHKLASKLLYEVLSQKTDLLQK